MNFWDLSKEEMEKLLAEQAKKEIAETHAEGRPTTHGDDQGVYQLYPGGRREYIKRYVAAKMELEPPLEPQPCLGDWERYDCPHKADCRRYVLFREYGDEVMYGRTVLAPVEDCNKFMPLLTVEYERDEDGRYAGSIVQIPDIVADGKTIDELSRELARQLIEYAKDYYADFTRYHNSPCRRVHSQLLAEVKDKGIDAVIKMLLM